MIQSGHHPKDWLSGGIPCAINQLNWSAVPFNTRLFFVRSFLPWAGRKASVVDTVVLTRYANYYYFFLRCWIGKGSLKGGSVERLLWIRLDTSTVMVPCVKFVLGF